MPELQKPLEATGINIGIQAPPEVAAAGIRAVNEKKELQKIHDNLLEIGASHAGPETPITTDPELATGEVVPKNISSFKPKKDTTSFWRGLFLRKHQEQGKELKNAA